MTDAERAEVLERLAKLELAAIEELLASHERLHDLLNEVWKEFGLEPHSYDDPGVAVTTFTNEVRQRLLELEAA